MSIVNPNDINPSTGSPNSSIIFLANLIEKIPHARSRNARRASFLNSDNQYSKKEGTSNNPVIDSKTLDPQKNNKEEDDLYESSSSHRLSNMTQILDQNKNIYKNALEQSKILFKINSIVGSSFDKKKPSDFVYNMLRANSIKNRITNNMKIPSTENIKKISKNANNNSSIENNNSKKNIKEKISCCFFFK